MEIFKITDKKIKKPTIMGRDIMPKEKIELLKYDTEYKTKYNEMQNLENERLDAALKEGRNIILFTMNDMKEEDLHKILFRLAKKEIPNIIDRQVIDWIYENEPNSRHKCFMLYQYGKARAKKDFEAAQEKGYK